MILALLPTLSTRSADTQSISVYYDTLNTASGNGSQLYAPLSGNTLQWPGLISVNGYSYLRWTKDGPTYSQQNNILKIDETTKSIAGSYTIDYITEGGEELHQEAGLMADADGNILSVIVDLVQSPLYVRRHLASNPSSQELLAVLSPEFIPNGFDGNTYSAWNRLGSDLYITTRQGYQYIALYKSSDEGETWSEPVHIVDSGDPDTKWMYFFSVHPNTTNKFHLIVQRRHQPPPDFGGPFREWYYIVSEDADTWENIDGSFSKTVSEDGPVTLAELDSSCSVHECANDTDWCGCEWVGISNTGNIYMVGDKDATCNIFIFWDGDEWIKREIPSELLHNGGYNNGEPKGGYIFDDNTFDIFGYRTISGKKQIVKVRTYDKGLTWEDGGLISTDPDVDHAFMVSTYDFQNATTKLLACNAAREDGYNDIFIYEYVPEL